MIFAMITVSLISDFLQVTSNLSVNIFNIARLHALDIWHGTSSICNNFKDCFDTDQPHNHCLS